MLQAAGKQIHTCTGMSEWAVYARSSEAEMCSQISRERGSGSTEGI